MLAPLDHRFLLEARYHWHRHILYWTAYLILWAAYWSVITVPFHQSLVKMLIWCPAFMLFAYPIAYLFVPRLLLNYRYGSFLLVMIGWGVLGWYFNIFFRANVFFPLTELAGIWHGPDPRDPTSYLCMTTTAGSMTISSLAKRWVKKQQDWLQAEQEKVTAQIQLLKAQLHPHFLFNTLNNIYAFALERSPKTPQMILKLSSLLSYMLYECRTEEVLLEKEVEVMKAYIDLEKERYGDKIDISINIEGEIADQYIMPLLILPFLENAFKHGTSEQLDRPWMSLDILVKEHRLRCKVVNSKNEGIEFRENGVGINNVKKRLELLYPERYELKLADEGNFFMVSLNLQLPTTRTGLALLQRAEPQPTEHEAAMPVDR